MVALAVYKNAIQTYEHFSERREQDGGTRFKGTEYVQDFSYDCWVIDQLSEGVVPLFLPASTDNLDVVGDSFTYVAGRVAAARAQASVYPVTYPMSGADTLLSTPEWFHQPYESTTNLDAGLTIQETGDVAHNNPLSVIDDPTPLGEDLGGGARANSTAVTWGQIIEFTNGQAYRVTTAGTTAASQPSTTGVEIGEALTDGTAELERIN